MPAAIQNHFAPRDEIVNKLYNLFKLLQALWNKRPAAKSSRKPPTESQVHEPPRGRFDHFGPSVVPDADVQIIAHDNPGQPVPIRLSDLLPDANDPTNRSQDGDWVNASAIRLDALRQTLINEGYMVEGATLWWSPHALDTIDPAQLGTPQDGETRLTSMNLASTVRRAMGMYYPSHQQPCPENQDGTTQSPLRRPNFTIITRPRTVTGGALVPQQPELVRPDFIPRGSVTTDPATSRNPLGAQIQPPSVRPTIDEAPAPQRHARQQPVQASATTETPSPQAPPTPTPAPPRQPRVASVDDGPFDFTVPQSAIDALNAPGPGSGLFEYQGLSIVPRRNSSPEATQLARQSTAQPITQSAENTGEKRRRAPDEEPLTRPAQRRRHSNEATAQRDPSNDATTISMTFDASALPATEGLGETQRLGRALSVPQQPSAARSPPRPLATGAPRLRDQAFGTRRRQIGSHRIPRDARNIPRSSSVGGLQVEALQQPSMVPAFIPPIAEVTSRVIPSTGTDIFEQVGESWLGIRENRMPPMVQEAIASRRFTAEIDQGTERLTLTGDPEQPSGPVSAPLPQTTPPEPTRPVPIPRTSDDEIRASRKRRRRFTEYRRRPTDSSSSNSQDSPRKKRRINTSSSPDKQSPPSPKVAKRGVKRGAKRAPTEQERLLAGQVRDVSEGVRRLSTQSSRSAQPRKHRSSCVTT
ncbi:hypothetical protein PMG11_10754 [Penicillium brasilianum]|uniref:Uncharacterized protein n=1 Tax=Penicillium brasilianum TaxID=104259 RepID=A0A0F7U3H7_PENBI|nr:hypothetical protein PMG11_10754 [Penicillium brasilianum]